jgi:LPXTG-motif cell wall-anchored protein
MKRRSRPEFGENKTHFKLFKSGKNWIVMGVSLITFGTTALISNVDAHASVNQNSADVSEESNTDASGVNEPVHVLKTTSAESNSKNAGSSSATINVGEDTASATESEQTNEAASPTTDTTTNQSINVQSVLQAKNAASDVEPADKGTYTATYTYKDSNGTALAPEKTTTARWTSVTDVVIDPVHIPGYQIDTAASMFSLFGLTGGIYLPISTWMATMPGQYSSFNDFFTRLILRQAESYGDDTQSDSAHFNFVYKKSNAKIVAKDVTITVGDALPSAGDFVSEILDDSGSTLNSSKVVITNLDDLNNSIVGDYQVNLEYFDESSFLSIITTATLHVTPATTSSQVAVNTQSTVYGDDYNFTLTSNGSDLIVPSGLTNSDFTIVDSKYSKSGALSVGEYEVQLNDSGKQKVAEANPNLSLTDTNYVAGTITVAKKTATVTAQNGTSVYGDPIAELEYTENGIIDGDDINISLSRYKGGIEGGTDVGEYLIGGDVLGQDVVNYQISVISAKYTITPKATDPKDETTKVTVGDKTITYGDATPTFTVSYGSKVNSADLTNEDFNFDGSSTVPTNVGNYVVTLNDSGQAKIKAANPNYTFADTDFIAGSYTITPQATDPKDETTKVTVGDKTITYGDATPTFTVSYGSKVNSVDLTNEDFNFDGSSTVPTNVGDYVVTLNDSGQAKIKAANPNYTFADTDFIAGSYTITPKSTTPGDVDTKVKIDDVTIHAGQKVPSIKVSYGNALNAVTLTNADFNFNNQPGVPSLPGVYVITLSESGIAKIRAANPNYNLSEIDFVSGLLTIIADNSNYGNPDSNHSGGQQGGTISGSTQQHGQFDNNKKITGDTKYAGDQRLPQTGEQDDQVKMLSMLGLVIGLLGLTGLKKRKKMN